jgi:hypothetical protein
MCALAAEIRPPHRSRGRSGVILQAMSRLACEAELGWLIARVRPSFKERYPIIPIERYAAEPRP